MIYYYTSVRDSLLQNSAADVVEANASVENTEAGGGEFLCEPPCKYKAKKFSKLQRHQSSKQGCIRFKSSELH